MRRTRTLADRLRASALAALVAAALVAVPAVPAAAAQITVTDETSLADALTTASAGDEIVLADDIEVAAPQLVSSASVILDLAGYDLTLNNLTLAPATTLTIRDSVGGGTLDATGEESYAGITVGAAALVVESGDITARGGLYGAGIGGDRDGPGGSVTVDGGTVSAYGGDGGAGIGSGNAGGGGAAFTITAGTVTAEGGRDGAGIGAGWHAQPGTFTMSGGTVTATGGAFGSGVGGATESAGGVIRISAGTLTAIGGSSAAGIGGGWRGDGGDVGIDGGTVTASGGLYGAGIGSGWEGVDGGILRIAGGVLDVTGGLAGAGIGGGYASRGADVSISGGTVDVRSLGYGAGIGGGYLGDNDHTAISGGTVAVTGGGGGAAIGGGWGGDGGAITIHPGATVIAQGGVASAGLGGGLGGDAGVIILLGGTITATGGPVGSDGMGTVYLPGAGIGAGGSGDGGTVFIDTTADVTASGRDGATALGAGSPVNAFGSATIQGTLRLPAGAELIVASGGLATVTGTGLITGAGSLSGTGTITNLGTITNIAVDDILDGGTLTVNVNNYLVTFDGNHPAATPAEQRVRVYATTFTAGERIIPSVTRTGFAFTGWFGTPVGGAAFTAATPLSSDRTVYAQWDPPAGIRIDPDSATVGRGDSVTFRVFALDGGGADLGDVTAEAVLTSDGAGDTVSGSVVTFGGEGDRTVTATLPGTTLSADASVLVSVPPTVTPPGTIALTGDDTPLVALGIGILLLLAGFGALWARRRNMP